MSGTIWALVPPIVAIALALWTKEVYLSLLIGILSGALLFTKFHIFLDSQPLRNHRYRYRSLSLSLFDS